MEKNKFMSDWDTSNLAYMQSLSDNVFDVWILSLSDEDLDYAVSLYRRARTRNVVFEHNMLDDIEDVTQARVILEKIKKLGA
jgi:hypothetical protein